MYRWLRFWFYCLVDLCFGEHDERYQSSCPTCDGRGRMNGTWCPECDGKAFVRSEEQERAARDQWR